jgi:hypothetical protein
MSESVHILGVRHHGPGSARSVVAALDRLQPDHILIEGPSDVTDLLPFALADGMRPPVALLVYVPDQPKRGVYYPFAEYSPEWQAIRFALAGQLPVAFMDLPQCHWLAMEKEDEPVATENEGEADEKGDEEPQVERDQPEEPGRDPDENETEDEPGGLVIDPMRQDPLMLVARQAGFSDGERWWEHMIEQRSDSTDVFKAVTELMAALREQAQEDARPVEKYREASMRQAIRAALKAGRERIAVICGAWHAPALGDLSSDKADRATLNGLPKLKVSATWVPWSNRRLTYYSGYGAGIESPGYYHHLWTATGNTSAHWMTRVATLLREQDLDASVASVIDSVRLADSLAAVRDLRRPGLAELNEAACAALCFGDDIKMRLIADKLIVGDAIGEVPESAPMVPLQRDLQQAQKRLRMGPESAVRTLDLDLRKPTDLERSYLLHRLGILGIHWGQKQGSTGKGTFHELWQLRWEPEMALEVIEASIWGNTVAAAATARAVSDAACATDLSALTTLVQSVLLADLPGAVEEVMARLQNLAALTSDVPHLMDALPALAGVMRYGNVRQTDVEMVGRVVDGLIARICIGLPAACSALNDEAAEAMLSRVIAVNESIALLQNDEHLSGWVGAMARLADQQSLHGLIAGRCCRLLFDRGVADAQQTGGRMNAALSTAVEPAQAAAWIDGFIRGSGQVLLHNSELWQVIDSWVVSLGEDAFTPVLPLLRRTFSTFSAPERRQLGQRAKQAAGGGQPRSRAAGLSSEIDTDRADRVLPLLAALLGVSTNAQES